MRTLAALLLCIAILIAIGVLTRQRPHPPPHPCAVDPMQCRPPTYSDPDRKQNYEGFR